MSALRSSEGAFSKQSAHSRHQSINSEVFLFEEIECGGGLRVDDSDYAEGDDDDEDGEGTTIMGRMLHSDATDQEMNALEGSIHDGVECQEDMEVHRKWRNSERNTRRSRQLFHRSEDDD